MSNKRYDQHIHSSFSYDANQGCTIPEILNTAVSIGLAGIAVTDHFDPYWPEANESAVLYLPDYQAALTEAEKSADGRIQFAKGIEFGFFPGETLDICQKAVSGYPYDFVIGSMHSSKNEPLHYPSFHEGRTLSEILDEFYNQLLACIKYYKNYDVLGHINYIDRYTEEIPPESLYMPYIDEVLRLIISEGKGIEINCATFGRLKRSDDFGTPNLPILKHYKDIGGEIVTIGSDAHSMGDIGAFIANGEDLLRSAGFKYLAVFKNRQPEFIPTL